MGRASAIRRSGLCGRGTFVLKVSALRAPSLSDAYDHSVRERECRAHVVSSSSNPGSSSTGTPSRSAFSSLEPGEAPATT
jgi:hypothetical protein